MENALLWLVTITPGITPISCDTFAPACITNITTLSNLLVPLIYIVAALVLLGIFIAAAFGYVHAQGDPTAIKKAQQSMSYAVLGIIVVILAFVIVKVVTFIFDIPFLL